ncbi:GNAT family N-acetyltransferase [Actinokineospora soli]|uniref:GNAT family N-acetyltransferase n=1 Tax=Actinokineospora soli TaxID=1048753 RepID=A0ABW2TV07_9PSEU
MLPEGYTERPAALTDAEAVLALVAARNTAAIGFPDYTIEDARNDLDEPGFDRETDSWLVHRPDGTLAGMGWTFRKGTGEQADIDAVSLEPAVVDHLLTRAIARAAAMAAEGGHPACTAGIGVYRADEPLRAAAASFGFTAATTFHRMRVDHADPVEPDPIPGLTLETGPGDEQFRRTAHHILNESFKDHFGWAVKPFDQWQSMLDQDENFDWPQLTVASLDGTPCALLLVNNAFASTDSCGYVADLGVLDWARGKGIARYLLRKAFVADHKAGHTGTILHVDTNNTTPALTLYENVGMRPVLVIDAWRRVVPAQEG